MFGVRPAPDLELRVARDRGTNDTLLAVAACEQAASQRAGGRR